MNTINITTKAQTIAVANEVLKKGIKKMLKISVYPDNNKIEVTSATGDYSVEETVVPLEKGIVKVKNFTKEVVSIQFYDKGEDTTAKENAMVYSHCAINYTATGVDILPYTKEGFKSLTTGTSYKLEQVVAMGAILYIMGPISASEGRKATATLYKVDTKSSDLVGYIDGKSYGAFSMQYGKEMERVALQKIATRFGQWKTGMGLRAPSSAPTALFVGKWNLDGFNYADGHGFINMDDLAYQLSMATEKYSFTTSAVEGLMVQHRPYSMWKLESLVVSPYFMRTKMAFDAKGEDNFVWVKRDASNQAIYNSAFESKDLQGKIIILYSDAEDLGKPQRVCSYTDLNGAKASHDITCNTGMNIMKIDKPKSKGGVNLNTQFLESAIYADLGRTSEIVLDIVEKEVAEKIEMLKTAKVSIPSIRDVETGYIPAVAKAIAPKYSLANKRLYNELAEDTFKGLSKKAKHLSYSVDGKNRLLTCDPSAHFGVRLLSSEECLIPGKMSGVKVVAMRNPKMTPGEFLVLTTVSKEDYIERLQASDLDAAIVDALVSFVQNLTKSCMALPAFSDTLDMLGGADFDGDTAAVIETAEIVNVFEKIQSMAIRVNNVHEAAKSEKVKFDVLSFGKAFYDLINNGNKSIGEVTYMANLLLALIGQIRGGKRQDAIHFFKDVVETNGGNGEYVSLKKEAANVANAQAATVSFDVMFDIIDRAKSMALTDENMIAVLEDLVTCHMMLQMETIDAPKKGTKVPVAFKDLLKKMSQASKTDLFVSPGLIDRRTEEERKKSSEKGGIIFAIEDRSGKEPGKVNKTASKKYIVQDDIHGIRVKAARKLFAAAQDIRAFKPENYDEYENFFRLAKEQLKGAGINSFTRLKFMANSIFAAGMQKADQQIMMEALANTARAITPGISAADRGRLAEYVSMPKAGTNNTHSPFALKVLHKEYLHMLMENFAEGNVYGEEILVHKNIADGEVMEFVSGLYIDGEKSASVRLPINGEFMAKELNGKMYAVREIEKPDTSFNAKKGIFVRVAYKERLKQEALIASGKEVSISENGTVYCGTQILGDVFRDEVFGIYKGLKGSVASFFVTEENTINSGKNRVLGMVIVPEGEIFEETEMFEEDYEDMDSMEDMFMEEYDSEALFA